MVYRSTSKLLHFNNFFLKAATILLLITLLAGCAQQAATLPPPPPDTATPKPVATAVPDTPTPESVAVATEEATAEATQEATEAAPAAQTALDAPVFSDEEIAALMDDTPHPDVSGTLTIWGYYNGPIKAVAESFNKLYPNVKIEVTDFGLDDNHARLLAAFTAGTGAPDIAMIQNEFVATVWGPDGGLLDLSDKMKPLTKYYAPEAMRKVTDVDGHIWGVPWDLGPAILWYRQDIFEKYGIEPDSIKTWDDYIAAGKKIDEGSGGKVKMLISNQILNQGGLFIVLSQDHTMLSQQLGSGWWDNQGNPILDNEANIRAMELLKRFRDEGITLNDVTGEAEVATMKDASVATYAHAAWWQLEPKFLAPETEGVWGFMKIPAFEEGGVRASNFGGTSFYITKESKQQELAWEFLKFFLLRPDSRALSYKNSFLFEAIVFPAIQKESVFTDPDPFFNGENPNKLAIEVMLEAPPIIEARGHKEARAIFDENVGDILNGTVSVEEGMKRINDLIKDRIKG